VDLALQFSAVSPGVDRACMWSLTAGERHNLLTCLFLAAQPPWQMGIDPASGKPYYYNTTTMQTQWEFPRPTGAPAGIPPAANGNGMHGGGGGYAGGGGGGYGGVGAGAGAGGYGGAGVGPGGYGGAGAGAGGYGGGGMHGGGCV